jgi:hypothetical protein
MSRKPTIEELQKILDDPEEHPIEIQPDGSIKVDRRKKVRALKFLGQHIRLHEMGSSY